MTDITKVVKRLQRVVDYGQERAGTLPARDSVKVWPEDWHAICDTAKAVVALFEAEHARAEAAEAKLAERDKEAGKLREALRPFGEYLDTAAFDIDNKGNPLPDSEVIGWAYLTIGQFRRARAALSEPSPSNSGDTP